MSTCFVERLVSSMMALWLCLARTATRAFSAAMMISSRLPDQEELNSMARRSSRLMRAAEPLALTSSRALVVLPDAGRPRIRVSLGIGVWLTFHVDVELALQ